jgi:hypothetical protein
MIKLILILHPKNQTTKSSSARISKHWNTTEHRKSHSKRSNNHEIILLAFRKTVPSQQHLRRKI